MGAHRPGRGAPSGRRALKRVLLAAAAVAAAATLVTTLTLPPPHLALQSFADGTVAGSLHIHTVRSDGSGTPDQVAAAAARAGLGFIVFTDHGDATRTPDPPTYRSGVLCLDGVEISTSGGHYIALDMPAAPYPLAGEPRDVVEDVRRLGGFGVAAHPNSPKPALRWTGWDAPFDGLELVNLDTGWRVRAAGNWRSRLGLLAALFHYPLRPAETVASVITGASATLAHWSALAARRRVVGLAGADAHARLAFGNTDPGDSGLALSLPSYEASFRALSLHVRTERPFTGDATADAAVLMRAIRAGHAYVATDGVATPAAFEFTASDALGTVREGDELGAAGPVTLHVRSNAPAGFTTLVYQDRHVLAMRQQRDVTVDAPGGPAVYRVEIRSPTAVWLYSNPIYVRAATSPAPPAPPAVAMSKPIFTGTTDFWRVEHDATSTAQLTLEGSESDPELQVRYHLGEGAATGQYVTLIWGTNVPPGIPGFDRLGLTLGADRPMRLALQLRTTGVGGPAEQWQRSIYVDRLEQPRTVPFVEFSPGAPGQRTPPPLDQVNAVLFVVDTLNTKPGTDGRFWVKSAALER